MPSRSGALRVAAPQRPELALAEVPKLVRPAFAIALLGAIESLLTAVVADGMVGTRHNSNQELIGQGAANILAPIFGGFAATGAIARTATSVRNGATSPLAGIVHSVFLVLVYRIYGPFFFGAAEKLESTVERAQLHVETVVIRLNRVPFMDATGMHTLSEIIDRFQRRGIRMLLCGIQPRLPKTLERAEILALVGPDNVFADMAGVARRVTPA